MTAASVDQSTSRLLLLRKLQFVFVAVGAVVIPVVIVAIALVFAPTDPSAATSRATAGGILAAGFGSASLAMMAAISYTVGQRRSGASCAILALVYLAVGVSIGATLA